MALTGRIFKDLNQSLFYDAGDLPWSNTTMRIQGVEDAVDQTTTTDINGLYTFDDSVMTIGNHYTITVFIPPEWATLGSSGIVGNPSTHQMSALNEVRNGAYFQYLNRPASSWVKRIWWVQGATNPGSKGVYVTFERRGKFFTAFYPGTTLDDYNWLVNAASKGRWIHTFYYRIRQYLPTPVTP